jgi:hypothetical protein
MEPQWTRQISNSTVCDWYYILFLLNAFVAVVAVLGTLMVVFGMKLQKGLAFAFGFQGLLTIAIATISSLFMYLVCDRSLLGKGGMKEGFYSHSACPPGKTWNEMSKSCM